MNFREGMRRLGILLGAAGGIVGGFLAFVPDFGNATGLWNTLTAHRKFEAAMTLPTVQKAISGMAHRKAGRGMDLSQYGTVMNAPATGFVPPPLSSYQGPAIPLPPGAKPVDNPYAEFQSPLTMVSTEDQNGGITIWASHPLLKGNRDGIDGVYFDSANRVTQIRFATGEWLYQTQAPKISAYLLLLAFPVVGFLIPWGAIHLVTWVGTGFFASKSG